MKVDKCNNDRILSKKLAIYITNLLVKVRSFSYQDIDQSNYYYIELPTYQIGDSAIY